MIVIKWSYDHRESKTNHKMSQSVSLTSPPKWPPLVTACSALSYMKGTCIALCSQPWLALSSHISHETTSHRHRTQSRTHLRCSSHHNSHIGSHCAHLLLLRSCPHTTSVCFFPVHQRTSASRILGFIRDGVTEPLIVWKLPMRCERKHLEEGGERCSPLCYSLICFHYPS